VVRATPGIQIQWSGAACSAVSALFNLRQSIWIVSVRPYTVRDIFKISALWTVFGALFSDRYSSQVLGCFCINHRAI